MMRCVRSEVPSYLFAGWLICVALLSARAEEREHVTLVDPASTRCTVCHKTLDETHEPAALEAGCLSCHAFAERDGTTYLVVPEAARAAGAPTIQAEPRGGSSADEEVPRGGGTAAVRAEPPATVPSPAPVAPRSPAVQPPAAGASSAVAAGSGGRPATSGAGSHGDSVRAASRPQYAAGVDEFRRGNVEAAFGSWQLMLDQAEDGYTLQVAVDRYLESARYALETYPGQPLFVIPRKGSYYVLAGIFSTREEAAEGLRHLPDDLIAGGAFPIPIRTLISGR